jgi:hypothetical protein
VELEPMDDFERELREAMRRQSAPAGLKPKILAHRRQRRARRFPSLWIFQWGPATAALAAMVVVVVIVAAGVGGFLMKREAEEHRRGEEAKQQVFTALRIANRALEEMNVQLEERNRKAE